MNDDIRPGGEFRDRHVPMLGGIGHQHLADLRAEHAQTGL